MNGIRFLTATLLLSASAYGLQLRSGVFNPIGQTVSPSNSSTLPATTPQFRAVGTVGTHIALPASSAEDATDSSFIILTASEFGGAFASASPRYFFGDVISPPLTEADGSTPLTAAEAADYWRARPVFFSDVEKPSEVLSSAFDSESVSYTHLTLPTTPYV